jgi:hypothetical protein
MKRVGKSGSYMNNFDAALGIIKLYVGWILIHYLAVHLYAKICVPTTLSGFLMSPLMAPSPHCVGLRWAINTGGASISAMWLVVGFALVKRLTPIKQN